MKLPPPFSQHTFEDFIEKICIAVNHEECAAFTNLAKKDQLYRIKQIFSNLKTVNKYLKQPEKLQLLSLDMISETIEDKFDLENFLKKNINNKFKKTVIFVLEADRLLEERKNLLAHIDSLYHRTKILFIFFLQKNIRLNRYSKNLSHYSTLYQNLFYFPLLEKKDIKLFLKQMEVRFQIKIDKEIENMIIDNCAGYTWLIEQAVRNYSQNQNKNEMFTNEGMLLRLKILYDEFEEEEKKVLEKILKKDQYFSDEEKLITDYFTKIKLLKINKKYYEITASILADYIDKIITVNTTIWINLKDQIILNNIMIDRVFSQKEKKLLKYFLSNKLRTISREEAAEAFWREKFKELYTDWALDQIIKRLRKKFASLGLHKNLIKTIKNQGYIISN